MGKKKPNPHRRANPELAAAMRELRRSVSTRPARRCPVCWISFRRSSPAPWTSSQRRASRVTGHSLAPAMDRIYRAGVRAVSFGHCFHPDEIYVVA